MICDYYECFMANECKFSVHANDIKPEPTFEDAYCYECMSFKPNANCPRCAHNREV